MIRIILFSGLVLVLFVLLYDIYKTKTYKKPRQIVMAVAGTIILVTLLFTCESDDPGLPEEAGQQSSK